MKTRPGVKDALRMLPTAAILVGSYCGLGVHTESGIVITRLFIRPPDFEIVHPVVSAQRSVNRR